MLDSLELAGLRGISLVNDGTASKDNYYLLQDTP